MHTLHALESAQYAVLRTFRRDGTPIDTPIWFAFDGDALLFRTKVGPKTKRLTARPEVELAACDYRGRVRPGAPTMAGRATVLSGAEAERANRVLHKRYGWQWNIVPLLKIPGVTNVHRDLPFREKLRRARDRGVWRDSVIVRIDRA
ncbi:PPOX class F420-dependent oxidoreductase [Mycobacterium angelicum]|uniref:PPOX class F420-dependent enzyme n=1 Tax=Mycobacterium angelicum TaxID=470074 RepID=A0A1X0A1A5_MYCAN|nr:PPOX class F420-dependent oxidoreductase [Mycobacterium angelicum]MCV7195473.1 PPOX class F420-dependent oxidoreductase [Mycobacterium angelicum]ORA23774.1 PPOX class F420-dependent enzyme [Mycobacterium angelicum]